MPEYTYQTEHVEDAESLLLSQFASSTQFHGLVQCVGAQAQELEDVDEQLYVLLDVDTAEGAQLTTIGEIVGELRNSREDTPFRAWISARIAVNNSEGTPRDIYRVARLIIGSLGGHTLLLSTFPPAAYLLDVGGAALAYPWDSTPADEVAAELADILLEATAAGVELQLLYQTTDDAHTFTLASGASIETSALLGCADDAQTTGGRLAGVEARA